ncbi:hypothetical protein Tco_1161451, partial [Tanacetum coccineum]
CPSPMSSYLVEDDRIDEPIVQDLNGSPSLQVNVSDEGYPKSQKEARDHPIEQVIFIAKNNFEGNALDLWILALEQGEQRSRESMNNVSKNTLKVMLLTHGSLPWNKEEQRSKGEQCTMVSISLFYKDINLPIKDQDPAFLILQKGEKESKAKKDAYDREIASNYRSKEL